MEAWEMVTKLCEKSLFHLKIEYLWKLSSRQTKEHTFFKFQVLYFQRLCRNWIFKKKCHHPSYITEYIENIFIQIKDSRSIFTLWRKIIAIIADNHRSYRFCENRFFLLYINFPFRTRRKDIKGRSSCISSQLADT